MRVGSDRRITRFQALPIAQRESKERDDQRLSAHILSPWDTHTQQSLSELSEAQDSAEIPIAAQELGSIIAFRVTRSPQ